MLGIRLDGRGGQGAVSASKILAQAYYLQGFSVQSFPSFGMERRGAPVSAFVRVDERPILRRGRIEKSDVVIVLDPALLLIIDVTEGLTPKGLLLLNHTRHPGEIDLKGDFQLATVDATKLALAHGLGSSSSPMVNTVLLGALARLRDDLNLDNVLAAIGQNMPVKVEANMAAARQAFDAVERGWVMR
ncbi:MAG: 2-oxoacid:acceptor oxidoreductase family protein [Thermodesulfobacteriota bacterium]